MFQVHSGGLGAVDVADRAAWRSSLEGDGSVALQLSELSVSNSSILAN